MLGILAVPLPIAWSPRQAGFTASLGTGGVVGPVLLFLTIASAAPDAAMRAAS
jgi:hypothetical protein